MKKIENSETQELALEVIEEINGTGLFTGPQSLFRSAMYFGVKAYDAALTGLGILAGLGDGIEAGLHKE